MGFDHARPSYEWDVQSATLLPDGTVLVGSGNLETVVPSHADLSDPGSSQ